MQQSHLWDKVTVVIIMALFSSVYSGLSLFKPQILTSIIRYLSSNIYTTIITSLSTHFVSFSTIFFVYFFESYVRHEHPLWSDDQVDSKASFYKSFLDGTSCVVSLFMLPILGILPSSLPTLSRTISFPFSLFFISVIYLILYQVVSLIYLEERR